jgi:phage baseplate assembly protein W
MDTTYGINFPFSDSTDGTYLKLTKTVENEVRTNLIHYLLTKKGSRYFLPDFGTRLHEYIFDQNDVVTFSLIEEDIRDGVKKYIPNVDITSLVIVPGNEDVDEPTSPSEDQDNRLYRVSDSSTKPYTAKVKLSFTVNNGGFTTSDFVIINI